MMLQEDGLKGKKLSCWSTEKETVEEGSIRFEKN
jgi:hypothetical protein